MATPSRQAAAKIASFKIAPEEYRRLEEVAEREERSVSAVIRIAVRQYLDEADGQAAA